MHVRTFISNVTVCIHTENAHSTCITRMVTKFILCFPFPLEYPHFFLGTFDQIFFQEPFRILYITFQNFNITNLIGILSSKTNPLKFYCETVRNKNADKDR